jgi:hypothetical protein
MILKMQKLQHFLYYILLQFDFFSWYYYCSLEFRLENENNNNSNNSNNSNIYNNYNNNTKKKNQTESIYNKEFVAIFAYLKSY